MPYSRECDSNDTVETNDLYRTCCSTWMLSPAVGASLSCCTSRVWPFPVHVAFRPNSWRASFFIIFLVSSPNLCVPHYPSLISYVVLVCPKTSFRLEIATQDHARHLYVPGGEVSWNCRDSDGDCATNVLNCTVRPRYNGDSVYATPPATAKKAPHCSQCQQ